jgi:hypothetical protein
LNEVNRHLPDLRLERPHYFPYDVTICLKYYCKYLQVHLQEGAATEVVGLLLEFKQEHPTEWNYCGWKSDAIADLMMGRFGQKKADKDAAVTWLRSYWGSLAKEQRRVDLSFTPKRTAAEAAAWELAMLRTRDRNPSLWVYPGFRVLTSFVRWLNKNWDKLASKKKGPALLETAIAQFHHERPKAILDDEVLAGICRAYENLANRLCYREGEVPPSAVVYAYVAKRHVISPRQLSKFYAELRDSEKRYEKGTGPKAVTCLF